MNRFLYTTLVALITAANCAFAVETAAGKTEDPAKAEAMRKEAESKKEPIEVRREMLKKKHKEKKKAQAAAMAASATTTAAEPPTKGGQAQDSKTEHRQQEKTEDKAANK